MPIGEANEKALAREFFFTSGTCTGLLHGGYDQISRTDSGELTVKYRIEHLVYYTILANLLD